MKKKWILICFVCFFACQRKNVDCLFVHRFIVPNFALSWLGFGCFQLWIYLSNYLSIYQTRIVWVTKNWFFSQRSHKKSFWNGKNIFTSVIKCATHIFLCTTQWFGFAHALFSNEFRWKCLCDIQLSVSKIIQCHEIETETKNTQTQPQTYSHTHEERESDVCACVCLPMSLFLPLQLALLSHLLALLVLSMRFDIFERTPQKDFAVTACCWVYTFKRWHT